MTCRYELRAHGHFEHCPECGTTVAQSRHHADHQHERDVQHLKIALALGWTAALIVANLLLVDSLMAVGLFVILWALTLVASIILLYTIAGGRAERVASKLVYALALIASLAGGAGNALWYWMLAGLSA